MIRERLARWPLARERRHGRRRVRGPGGGNFRRQFVLRSRGFKFFQRELKLIQQSSSALGTRTIAIAIELFDLQLQMRDQRLVVGGPGFGKRCVRLRDDPSATLGNQRSFQCIDIIWQRFKAVTHPQMESQKQQFGATFLQSHAIFRSLSRALRPPGMLWISPVDRLQQIAHLSRGQCHHAVHRCRPNKAATIQSLRIKR